MGRGFIGGMFGGFFGIIFIAVVLIILIYIFGPNYLPTSPCLIDKNCEKQRLCCTWRCDSLGLDWWNCPDQLCAVIGKTQTKDDFSCKCNDLKCNKT